MRLLLHGLVAIWIFSGFVSCNDQEGVDVVLHKGIQSCVPLVETNNVSAASLGFICFQLSSTNGLVFVSLQLSDDTTAEVTEGQLEVRETSATHETFQQLSLVHMGSLPDTTTISANLATDYQTTCTAGDEDGVSLSVIFQARTKRRQQNETRWNLLRCRKVTIRLPCFTTTNTTTASRLRRRRTERYHVVQPIQRACPPLPTSTFTSLTEEFLLESLEAFKLINMITTSVSGDIEDHITQGRRTYARFNGWGDYNDQALVAKTRDTKTCYAVFEGTQSFNIADQIQNLAVFNTAIPGTDCIVRQGYNAAYFTSYYEDFRDEVDACVASCIGGCPLILSGYSQGGAVAVVASIDLRIYNPKVITWGAPRAIHNHDGELDSCRDANPNNHYRFVNLWNNWFDRVPAAPSFFNAKHVGHLLLLDDENFPIGGTTVNDDRGRIPWSDVAHQREVYQQRMQAMVNRGCFPVPVGKWPAGHFCGLNSECESGSTCERNRCVRKRPLPLATPSRGANPDVFP